MKKSILKTITLCVLCCFLFSGCSKANDTKVAKHEKTSSQKQNVSKNANVQKEVKNKNWFKFNPYAYPKTFVKFLGKKGIAQYKALVDAYQNYQTSATIDKKYLDIIFYNIQILYPLFDNDTKYDLYENYNNKTKKLHWKYTDNKEDHDKKLDQFEKNITTWINSCTQQNDPELVKIIALYKNFSANITYNMKSLDAVEKNKQENIDISINNALNNKTGICTSFAGGYAYLLSQIGVDSAMIGGFTTIKGKSIGHAWTLFEYNGKQYFADPTMERKHSVGKGLLYFGEDLKQRIKDGFPKKNMVSDIYGIPFKHYNVNGTELSVFHNMKNVTIDREKGCFHCTDNSGNQKDISFSLNETK